MGKLTNDIIVPTKIGELQQDFYSGNAIYATQINASFKNAVIGTKILYDVLANYECGADNVTISYESISDATTTQTYVKTALKNLIKTTTVNDATYATKIGSSTSQSTIGSDSNPVYVNDKGVVTACTNSKISVGTAAKWTTARTFTVQDNSGTNKTTTSIDGNSDPTLSLPLTIKASLTGNADSATKVNKTLYINNGESNTKSFNGSADVIITKTDLGLGSVVNTGDSATPAQNGTTKFTTGGAYTELAKKVDKVEGKGLSANDFTDILKNKLDDIYLLVYPVGSVYMTTDSAFKPADTFGGTWEQITNAYLAAIGSSTDTINKTSGGAFGFSITWDNIPAHTHSFTPSGTVSVWGGAHSHAVKGDTGYSGTHAHTVSLMNSGGNPTQAAPGSNSVIDENNEKYQWTAYGTSDAGSHRHSFSVTSESTTPSYSASFAGSSGTTGSKGASTASAIDYLPKYVGLYVWKRTK